jgi:ribonuclease HI
MQKETYRNAKKTDWMLFKEKLKNSINNDIIINNPSDLDREALLMKEAIIKSFHESCPLKTKISNKKCMWFTPYLLKIRKETRKLWNKAKYFIKSKDFINENVIKFRKAFTHYNNEIKKAKSRSWKMKCEEINNTTECSRIHKLLSKNAIGTRTFGTMKNNNGIFTNSIQESLTVLMETHFPGAVRMENEVEDNNSITFDDSENIAKEIVTTERLHWAINSFDDFKAAGADKIIPVMLKIGLIHLETSLLKLFKSSIKFGHIPPVWREVDVKFIPKPGKSNYSEAKSFRPISLMSFILKTLEKMIDMFIREKYIAATPFHKNQFAYQPGKSTEVALHHFVSKVEKSFEFKEIGLGSFLDIEGAFNNTCYHSITEAADRFKISKTLINWIDQMLKTRIVTATMHDESVTIKTAKGCPQGGCISCLLWLLVIDDLLCELNNIGGVYALGFADDVIIYTSGKFQGTTSNIMQQALKVTERWCVKNELSVNASKTVIIPFTKRRKINSFIPLKIFNENIKYENETKFLGVVIDAKLLWNSHINYIVDKAIKSFWMCRKLIGNNWGLKPSLIHWMYNQIIVPRITYGAIVWWKKSLQENTIKSLRSLQRMALLTISGAFKTAPTAALEIMLNILPLHLKIKQVAISTASRLASHNLLSPLSHSNELYKELNKHKYFWTNSDNILNRPNFGRNFEIIIKNKDDINAEDFEPSNANTFIFTDGSKSESGVGSGIHCPQLNINLSFKLGDESTVFQSEINALNIAAESCMNMKVRGKTLTFCTDSQAVLNALRANKIRSLSLMQCINKLNAIAEHNKVVLKWIPGHCGYNGNEIADTLAKNGSTKEEVDKLMPISISYFKDNLQETFNLEHLKHWLKVPGQNIAKKLVGNINAKRAKEILNLKKSEIKTVSRCLTGHNLLNYHMKRIGLSNDDKCRFCNIKEETSEHILLECTNLADKRMKIFSSNNIEPSSLKIHLLLDYFKLLNLTL